MLLSYCYFHQNWKLVFRKEPVLVPLALETDKTNSRGANIVLPTATYTPNWVCTSQTDDRIAATHVSLPHITVLFDSPKLSSMAPVPKVSCETSQTNSQKFINMFWKSKVTELDMQAMHDRDAHHSPCYKTLSMAKTLEINNPAIMI